MYKIDFVKPVLDWDAQLRLLQKRGLIITNWEESLKALTNIGYYRLSAYWITSPLDSRIDGCYKRLASAPVVAGEMISVVAGRNNAYDDRYLHPASLLLPAG